MNQFKITISMVNYLLYVIIIMLIYGIKIIRKMPIILTYSNNFPSIFTHIVSIRNKKTIILFIMVYKMGKLCQKLQYL
jgi:hypothetical protein